jgi:DNA-binding transcriptional LysR family regulator
MDIGWLEVFREVAQRGSFTAAAQAMGYTQSAISRQVSALESAAGATLFDRLPRGVRLTAEGKCLLTHAQAILDRLDAAQNDLAALRDLAGGHLRIGAFGTADAMLIPHAMAAFHAAHPKVTLTLSEGFTPDHVASLHTGAVDVAVLSTAPSRPFDTDRLDLKHLIDDHMLVALPTNHPLAHRRVLRLAELADERWITGNGRIEDTLINASLRVGFRPRVKLIAAEWIARQGLVAAGLGITLIPSLAVAATRPDVVLTALHPNDAPVRTIYAATPRGLTKPPAVTAFLDLLDNAVAELRVQINQRVSQ